MDIPLNANVECTDGLSGRSTYVIVNPIAQQVTHFVVKEKKRPHTERLVSLDKIEETTPNLIRLRCTKNELAKMEPFIGTYVVVNKMLNTSTGYNALRCSQNRTLSVPE